MPLTDEDLIQAIRQQILAQTRGGGAQQHEHAQRARQENAGGYDSISEGMSPEDLDYLVDIERRDVWDGEQKIGWNKSVHRYTEPKGKAKPPGKKRRGNS
jgi:hypothetical protein